MELDSRTHRTPSAPTTTSELFICFTSRLSNSSSMRFSSTKSILSPGRTDKPPVSLSTSLSRRLRTNGSLKGGQSPMFPPSVNKKRGCTFENPEPSSPKVTCIGQVRVKTKKQGRRMKLIRAKKRLGNGGGEVSFRNAEHAHSALTGENPQSLCQQQECLRNRNQKWVHLPLTICEALRGLGSEFNCFLPCKSSCFSSNERDKTGKGGGESGGSCGGGAFRWLVALHEGEGKSRDIELVVGGEEDAGELLMERETSRRRSIFDDMEFNDEICVDKNEEPRVSVCVPPKNALLLMRCRSDPMRMAALANKICDPSSASNDDDADHGDGSPEEEEDSDWRAVEDEEIKSVIPAVSHEIEEHADLQIDEMCDDSALIEAQFDEGLEREDEISELSAEEAPESILLTEANVEGSEEIEDGVEEEKRESTSSERISSSTESEEVENDPILNDGACRRSMEAEEREIEVKKPLESQETMTQESVSVKVSVLAEEEEEEEETAAEDEEECEKKNQEEEEGGSVLPDCLLLMMCEPKLSMEVSKETWICRTDFVKWLPERHPNQQRIKVVKPADAATATTELQKSVSSTASDSNPPVPPLPQPPPVTAKAAFQPPRSSCSFPVVSSNEGVPRASVDQKRVSTVAYEPFVLTRCKSAPMRSAAKHAPDLSCFWKNRKLEPHRPATFGVGF